MRSFIRLLAFLLAMMSRMLATGKMPSARSFIPAAPADSRDTQTGSPHTTPGRPECSEKPARLGVEPGPRDAAESVLHAGLERPLHLATILLAKQQVICFVGRSRV